MSVNLKPEHSRLAAELVAEAKKNDGLAPVVLERFHADQVVAKADPFGKNIPQCACGLMGMSYAAMFGELGVEEDMQRYRSDDEWRLSLNKAYNDKAERITGHRPMSEEQADPSMKFPVPRGLHDVFEGETVWEGGTVWLKQAVDNEEELKALLDRVEHRLDNGFRKFILPDNWDAEKERLTPLGVKPPRYRSQRGPVTFATSIYGVENLIFLIIDNPKLAERFRDLILRAMLAIGRVLDEEGGYTPETAPRGFSFSDDNCSLLTPEMYEMFGYPIEKEIYEVYCPDPGDRRFHHSDSDMEHLLPILGRLNHTKVNLGPNIMVDRIREHMPNTIVMGALAPFTFSRNEEENMVAEFLRDFEMAKESRGLQFETAGAINSGSRLTGLRLIMSAIQRYGRY
jgi:uroporphyrinogen decarboxylase